MHLESYDLFSCGPKQATASRCVSWNATGEHLAFGANNKQVYVMKVNTNDSSLSDVLTISGHKASVSQVRFHPSHATLLCTAARDHTVRLWDCRGGKQKDVGSIQLEGKNNAVMTVDWCRNSQDTEMSHALVVLDQTSHVRVFDTRKLSSVSSSSSNGGGNKENPAVLHHFQPRPKEVIEVTIFGPGKGQYLISASQLYDADKTSNISVWDWTKTANISSESIDLKGARFPAHVEGVYAMTLSPDGSRLATGGADSIVGLWDTQQMICTHTVSKHRSKYIRAVEFSQDGKILAHASEEDDIELVDSSNGEIIGHVNLRRRTGGGGENNAGGGRQSNLLPPGGAESLAWHPKQPLLACARVDTSAPEETSPPLVTVAKLNLKSR